jgi:hypothetical protein
VNILSEYSLPHKVRLFSSVYNIPRKYNMPKYCFLVFNVTQTKPGNLLTVPRSIYSHDERFNQVITTLQSIKKYVPDSDIRYIEGAIIKPEWEAIIKLLVTEYVNVGTIPYMQNAVDSILKGYGEGAMTKYALEHFDLSGYEHIIKFNGRYVLTPEFSIEAFTRDKPTFCMGGYNNKADSYSTVLYSFPVSYIDHVRTAMGHITKVFDDYEAANVIDVDTLPWYEVLVPKHIGDCYVIPKCGVLCYVGPTGHTFMC